MGSYESYPNPPARAVLAETVKVEEQMFRSGKEEMETKKNACCVDSAHSNEDAQFEESVLETSHFIPPGTAQYAERVDAGDEEMLLDF